MIRTRLVANLVLFSVFLVSLPFSSFAQKMSVRSSYQVSKPLEVVDVVVKNRSDGISTFSLEFNDELTESYADSISSFMMKNPDRLVFDLPASFTRLDSSSLTANGVSLVRGYSFISLNNKIRLVVDVSNVKSFKKQIEGKFLTLLLAGSEGKDVSDEKEIYSVEGEVSEAASNLITTDVKFRRAEQAGLVVVNLPAKYGSVDFSQTSQTLTLLINGVRLDPKLQKRVDVSDFSTAVQEVMTYQLSKDVVRIDIKNKGDWSYTSWQKGNELVIQVAKDKKNIKEGEVLSKLDNYYGDKLSVNFQQIEVRSLLQVIADFTALNIVVGDTVNGTITVRLKDVPWDQLLDIVLQNKGLAMRKVGNVLMVGSRDELLNKEKFAFETYNLANDLEPLVQEMFVINYQKAADVSRLLDDTKQRILSKRGAVVVDPNTNQMFVYDTASKIEEVKKIVAKVDIPVRQIVIEARIVEANDDFNRELGVKLGYNDRRSSIYREVTAADGTKIKVPVYSAGDNIGGGNLVSVSGSMEGVQNISAQGAIQSGSDYRLGAANTGTALAASNFVNLPGSAIDNISPASLALSFYRSGMTEFINLELSALESQSLGRVISSPRVVTTDRKKATIEAGTEISYSVFNGNGDATTAFKKVALKLEVTPHITPDGNVILEVILNKDNVRQVTAAGVTIDTKQVNTNVLIENGGTVVIGGIYAQEEKDNVTKVPFLGDIPVLGMLFRKKTKVDRKSETLLFITPKIIESAVFNNRN